MRIVTLAVAVLSLSLIGCSYSNLGLARTLDQGRFQFAAAPTGIANVGGYSGQQRDNPNPQVELALRYGLTDHAELGLKAWMLGAVLDGKLSLLRSDGESGMDVSLDPGVGLRTAAQVTQVGIVQLPVLVGFNFGGHQLVLAPKLVDEVAFGEQVGHTLFLGSSFGYAFKLGKGFRLMPEVTVMYPLLVNTQLTGASSVVVQVGLGILLGG